MSRPSVYLAGPITGLTYTDGQDWRAYAKTALNGRGIDAFSPLRGKEYLDAHGELDSGGTRSSYAHIPMSSPAGIVARDRMDCMSRDLVIANLLGAERVSIGTCIEFGWADAARVPIVVIVEAEWTNPHDHAMILRLTDFSVPTLDDALDIAAAVLLP